MRSRTEVPTLLLWDVIFGKKLTLRKNKIHFLLQLLKSFVFGFNCQASQEEASHGTCSSSIKIFIEDFRKNLFGEHAPRKGDDFNKSRVKSCQRKKWIMGKEQDVSLVPLAKLLLNFKVVSLCA